MSIARIGTRAAVVGLGVLASLALTTAPSWAAKGGNSGNAALCKPGGYPGALLNGHGEAFKNAGQCTKAGAHGELVGVDAVAEPAVGGQFAATYSGFGIKPGSEVFRGARYQPSGESLGPPGAPEVGANGQFLESTQIPCEATFLGQFLGKVSSVDIEAETAAGTVFVREFPPPTGC
jgi:hypothetical protein